MILYLFLDCEKNENKQKAKVVLYLSQAPWAAHNNLHLRQFSTKNSFPLDEKKENGQNIFQWMGQQKNKNKTQDK